MTLHGSFALSGPFTLGTNIFNVKKTLYFNSETIFFIDEIEWFPGSV